MNLFRIPAAVAGWLIEGYRRWISPMLPPTCRYTPTCSEYAIEAIDRFGLLRGGWLAVRRLLRCHPFGGWGSDPVPERPCHSSVNMHPHPDEGQ